MTNFKMAMGSGGVPCASYERNDLAFLHCGIFFYLVRTVVRVGREKIIVMPYYYRVPVSAKPVRKYHLPLCGCSYRCAGLCRYIYSIVPTAVPYPEVGH